MITEARTQRIQKIFELDGHIYAFVSTKIDLCFSAFKRYKRFMTLNYNHMHPFIHVYEAKIHDSKAMREIPYDTMAHYISDREYNDFGNLYIISVSERYSSSKPKRMSDSSPRPRKGGVCR